MNQQTLELILRMRDQATATWKKFESGIRGGMQRTGAFISKNWASIGVGIGAAFYVAIRALEKVDLIARKVAASAKDINAKETAQQLQKTAKYAVDAQKLVDQLIVRGAIFAIGVGNAIATFFATIYTGIAFVVQKATGSLATLAEYAAAAAHALGKFELAADLSVVAANLRETEKTAKSFFTVGVEHMMRYGKEATGALSAAFASSEALGFNFKEQAGPLGILSKQMNRIALDALMLQQELGKMKLPGVTTGGPDKNLEAQVNLEGELRVAMRTKELGEEEALLLEWYEKSLLAAGENIMLREDLDKVYRDRKAELDLASVQKGMQTAQSLASQAMSVLVGFSKNRTDKEIQQLEKRKNAELEAIDEELAKETLTEEQRNLLLDKRKAAENKFNRQIREAKKKQFQAEKTAMIIESVMATALAVVKSLPNIALAIAVGILGAAKTAVIAGQPTPEFHQGGVVPGPENREVPAILKGGETVRTAEQERSLGRPSVSVTININAPGTPVEMVKKALQEGLKATGFTSVDQFIVNNRSRVVLA
jgi:hypothetical protein